MIFSFVRCASASPYHVSIARFQGDKAGAISFTFDDGSQNQADVAVPLLDQFGFKGTFYVVAGLTRERKSDPYLPGSSPARLGGVSWEEWRQVAAEGHEIGNHSLTHPLLTRVRDAAALAREINLSADIIASEIGQPPITFAYPYNHFNRRVRNAVLARHATARERWFDYGHRFFSLQDANDKVDWAIRERRWFIVLIHGIEQGVNPLSRIIFRENLQYIKQREEYLWVDTFANISRYDMERRNARVSLLSSTPTRLSFTVTCSCDPNRFAVPLTVVMGLPAAHVAGVSASHQDQRDSLPVKTINREVLVDVVPGANPITVTWHPVG
jgi:peptidoglycan/xylan/chitin deacetylase (PgdA/CDA1 family)